MARLQGDRRSNKGSHERVALKEEKKRRCGSEVKYGSEPLPEPPLPSSQQRPPKPLSLPLKITRTKKVVTVMIIDKTKTVSAMRRLQYHLDILKIPQSHGRKNKDLPRHGTSHRG
ncbi:hypothetical protein V6N13_132105 [Hibiscus sabdariffa]|uniref:Uncharacterized protein n=1 Tax=Hibiscus sabdariffa TaxID=183260 RepID=A0ABR2BAY6_9ROSI